MIPRIKNILYATDLTKNSAYAFRYAVNSAQKHEAQIHILHVIEAATPAMEGILLSYLSEDELAKLKKEKHETVVRQIQERLQEFAQRELKDDPEPLKKVASVLVVSGDPAAEILQKADELNCDVVIMGSHGKGIISQTFLGSVSERVLHHIKKPVFIIPLPAGETDISMSER